MQKGIFDKTMNRKWLKRNHEVWMNVIHDYTLIFSGFEWIIP